VIDLMELAERYASDLLAERTDTSKNPKTAIDRVVASRMNLRAAIDEVQSQLSARKVDDDVWWCSCGDQITREGGAICGVCASVKDYETSSAIVWPRTAAEIRLFIGSNFNSRTEEEDGSPSENDKYSLTAHDLLSSFREWEEWGPRESENANGR
jgi:hypothetical protein